MLSELSQLIWYTIFVYVLTISKFCCIYFCHAKKRCIYHHAIDQKVADPSTNLRGLVKKGDPATAHLFAFGKGNDASILLT
jgi:hypothetical protein